MVYGHESQYGLGIPHLYDLQGFQHLSALMKFTSTKNHMGDLLQHAYEALQVELGIPGEIFQDYDPIIWNSISTPSWLGQTWSYASKQDIDICTGIPSLQPQCEHNMFLMIAMGKVGYTGKKLLLLNGCRLWLQVVTLSDITNGDGMELDHHILQGNNWRQNPKRMRWPWQKKPPLSSWVLWKEAILKAIPTTNGKQLTYPLGRWLDQKSDWEWRWNANDQHLAEHTPTGWCIWTPVRNWCFQTRYMMTDQRIPQLGSTYEWAVITKQDNNIYFCGS